MADELRALNSNDYERVQRALTFVEALMRSAGQGMSAGPFGLSFHTPPQRRVSPAPIPDRQVPEDDTVLVRIVSNASGGGKYNGVIVDPYPTSDVSSSGDLSESELGTADPDFPNALVLNLREMGRSTHDIEANDYVPTFFLGVVIRTNDDGTRVVVIESDQWEDCEESE